jgi:hypothetical protein
MATTARPIRLVLLRNGAMCRACSHTVGLVSSGGISGTLLCMRVCVWLSEMCDCARCYQFVGGPTFPELFASVKHKSQSYNEIRGGACVFSCVCLRAPAHALALAPVPIPENVSPSRPSRTCDNDYDFGVPIAVSFAAVEVSNAELLFFTPRDTTIARSKEFAVLTGTVGVAHVTHIHTLASSMISTLRACMRWCRSRLSASFPM